MFKLNGLFNKLAYTSTSLNPNDFKHYYKKDSCYITLYFYQPPLCMVLYNLQKKKKKKQCEWMNREKKICATNKKDYLQIIPTKIFISHNIILYHYKRKFWSYNILYFNTQKSILAKNVFRKALFYTSK